MSTNNIRPNPFYSETIWLQYKYNVLNTINYKLSPEQIKTRDKSIKLYNSMTDTIKIYDDMVESGATEEKINQLCTDIQNRRFVGYDDPVNEYRCAYGLQIIHRD